MARKYATAVVRLNREHPVFKRIKGDYELAQTLSEIDLNRLYKARKVMRGDKEPRDMKGCPYHMEKCDAQKIIAELTGTMPQIKARERRIALPFFGMEQI